MDPYIRVEVRVDAIVDERTEISIPISRLAKSRRDKSALDIRHNHWTMKYRSQ